MKPPHLSLWSFEWKIMGWGIRLERGTSYSGSTPNAARRKRILILVLGLSIANRSFHWVHHFNGPQSKTPMHTPISSGHNSQFSHCLYMPKIGVISEACSQCFMLHNTATKNASAWRSDFHILLLFFTSLVLFVWLLQIALTYASSGSWFSCTFYFIFLHNRN